VSKVLALDVSGACPNGKFSISSTGKMSFMFKLLLITDVVKIPKNLFIEIFAVVVQLGY
jgi:hypothetical protein